MKDMIKRINKYINLSIILSILFIIAGFLLIIWPKASLDTFSYFLGAIMLLYGTYNFIDSFGINPVLCLFQMSSSILTFLLGLAILLNPSIFESLLPIMLGILFIISGAFKTRIALIFKDEESYILSVITSILMIICGVVLILNPIISALVITTVVGAILIIYSVLDVVDMLIFKKIVKEIDKYLSTIIK